MKVRLSCHLIKQSGENFYCDCNHLPSPETSFNLPESSLGSQPLMSSSIAPNISFPPAEQEYVPALTSIVLHPQLKFGTFPYSYCPCYY